jgi:hypothetical protein
MICYLGTVGAQSYRKGRTLRTSAIAAGLTALALATAAPAAAKSGVTQTTGPHDGGTVTTTTSTVGAVTDVNKFGTWPGYPGGGSNTFSVGGYSISGNGGIYTNGQPSFGGTTITTSKGSVGVESTGPSISGEGFSPGGDTITVNGKPVFSTP